MHLHISCGGNQTSISKFKQLIIFKATKKKKKKKPKMSVTLISNYSEIA